VSFIASIEMPGVTGFTVRKEFLADCYFLCWVLADTALCGVS
jgi:hypothetical protein